MAAPRKPIFGMRQGEILAEAILDDQSAHIHPMRLFLQLAQVYHYDLLKATLASTRSEVITISSKQSSEAKQESNNHLFVRDPVLTIPELNLMLYTEGNKPFGAMSIIAAGKTKRDYKVEEVANAYFEAGNILFICISTQKFLFHGLQPGGFYSASKITPAETTKRLAEKLKPYNVTVIDLSLSDLLKSKQNDRLRMNHYYHLDCFMQILPNGKVVILNKKLLSAESIDFLEKAFKEDFIDLEYEDYLTKPVLLNFLTLQNDAGITAISPNLPDNLLARLQKLGLKMITPNMLDKRDKTHYDPKLAQQVAIELQSVGYETATAENLATHLPANECGYSLDNGESLPSSSRDLGISGGEESVIDEYYAQVPISFTCGSPVTGGPRCLIADIFPNVLTRKLSVASIPSSLFAENKTDNHPLPGPPEKLIQEITATVSSLTLSKTPEGDK